MASLHFPIVELALFLIFVNILYKVFKQSQPGLGLPPGPRPFPVFGNLHLLGDLPHQVLASLSKIYGPIMFLRLGSSPTLVVSSPAMAKEFLKTRDVLFANRPAVSAGKYVAYDRKDMVHAPYGEYWKQMKKLCTIELLSPKRTESFKCVREEEASAMIDSIWKDSQQGVHCVDLSKNLASLTLNIVRRMFASRTYTDHKLSGGLCFKDMIGEIMALAGAFVIFDFIPFLNYFDFQGLRRRMKAFHKIYDEFAHNLIDEHISQRRDKLKEERSVKDMVDALLDIAGADSHTTEVVVIRVHIKAIILCETFLIILQWTIANKLQDMLIGGVESSSTTIEWAMRELLRNPRVMATAQQEIESVVSRHSLVKESDIINCKYLQCVVKETFRLHPPGPLLVPHESTEGCNVAGYFIPAKTMLFVNTWAMGRDESVWEDSYQFKPERFIGKNIDARGQHYELLPFGTGRRVCPGISMGLSVVELALAQLIHCFDWSVEGEVNMEEKFGLTVPGKFPLSARPSCRMTTRSNVEKFG